MNEFSFIEKYLAPLAFGNIAALSLKDDAAILPAKPGYDTVITKDAISEGTHFFKDDKPYNLARKLLRVNLSDLAAKGATPHCCFLALMLPQHTTEEWLKEFTNGLKADLEEFGCFLAGGDTVVHNASLSLSLTAIGYVPTGTALLRSNAQQNDAIFVTGSIGDSYLGLEDIKKNGNGIGATSRYYTPLPRLQIGKKLRGIANSCTDISDGLLADLGHICECSNLGAEIMMDKIPLSPHGENALQKDSGFRLKALTGGDDYELLFTAPISTIPQINEISQQVNVPITQIGTITAGKKIAVLDNHGNAININNSGYKHKFG